MNWARIRYYIATWFRNIISWRTAGVVLSTFGVLWGGIEMVAFFTDKTTVPDWLRNHWWLFGLLGFLYAAWMCRPRLSVSAKLNERDVTITIAIGDLFAFDGSHIIGTNTTFDTEVSRDLISERSIQGQFTLQFYGDAVQLDAELATALSDVEFEVLIGKRRGKSKRYPLGTTVRLNPKDRTAYFTAIGHMNEYGNASGSYEGLLEALGQLWVCVSERGVKDHLVMPVLGTGFLRITQTREQVVREIIKSFIAACSQKTFCERLTIVLHEDDVRKHHIDINGLSRYLAHVCTYTQFADRRSTSSGRPAA